MKFANAFLAFVGLACAAPTETQDNAPKKPVKLARAKLPWIEPGPESAYCRSEMTEQVCGSKQWCLRYTSKHFRPDDKYQSPKECVAAREPAPVPKVVYRGEHTAPETFRKLGGIPTEFEGPTTNQSYSLEVHHGGLTQSRSAYTSTTSSFGVAFVYSLDKNAGDGWVYKIHPTPNMIDMDASDFFLIHAEEDEFSALGGVRWDQVEAWMAIPHNVTGSSVKANDLHSYRKEEAFIAKFPEMKWINNKDYNPKYDQFTVSGGQPQLAGNPPNLEKYKEKTLEQWATEFMDKNGKPVGWTGAFPLDLQPTVSKEPEPAKSEGGQGTPEEKQPAATKSKQQCAEIGSGAFYKCRQNSGGFDACYNQSRTIIDECSGLS